MGFLNELSKYLAALLYLLIYNFFKECPPGCAKCEFDTNENKLVCTECLDGKDLNFDCEYTTEEGIRIKCFEGCGVCTKDTPTEYSCKSCKIPENDLLYKCSCKKGECYLEGEECSSLENCQQCQYTDNLKSGLKCSKCTEKFLIENNQCTYLKSCHPHENCTKCIPKEENNLECLACSKPSLIPSENCIQKKIEYKETKKPKNSCDPYDTPEVQGKHCKSCDPTSFECTECYIQDNRYIKDGKCVCDVFYVLKNRKCELDETQNIISMNKAAEGLQTSLISALILLLLFHPSLFLNILESLQMISFTVFIKVDFPKTVVEFLLLFAAFDAGDLPQMVPDNKYYMPPPEGFKLRDNDALLLRNASQYIQLSCYLLIVYLIIKPVHILKIKKLIEKKQELSWIYQKILKCVQDFEYGVLIAGVSGSYLNLTVFCTLQLRSIAIDDLPKLVSFLMALCIIFIEVLYPFFIWRVATKLVRMNKRIEEYKQKSEKNALFQKKLEKLIEQKEQFDNKYGFFYELFKEDSKICAGGFLVIAIRKLIFGLTLVIFNNFPAFNLVVFLLLSISMIGINVYFKPYKDPLMNTFNIISEFLYIIFYCTTFPLLGDAVGEEDRKTIATVMMVSFLTLLGIELLFVIIENIRALYTFCQTSYAWAKNKFSKKKDDNDNNDNNNSDNNSNNNNDNKNINNNKKNPPGMDHHVQISYLHDNTKKNSSNNLDQTFSTQNKTLNTYNTIVANSYNNYFDTCGEEEQQRCQQQQLQILEQEDEDLEISVKGETIEAKQEQQQQQYQQQSQTESQMQFNADIQSILNDKQQ